MNLLIEREFRMKTTLSAQFALSLLLMIAFCCISCGRESVGHPPDPSGSGSPITPCGDFSFVIDNIIDSELENGVDVSLEFDFKPEICGESCSYDSILFIQIVRTVSGTYRSRFSYPSTQKKERATVDGWYIDRIDGYRWGYFGMDDNMTPGNNITSGNSTRRASLRDSPYRPDRREFYNIRWEAVTVPVCLDGDDVCDNKMLGFYYWSWTVSQNGTVEHEDVLYRNASETLEEAVSDAIEKWNVKSENWNTKEFPNNLASLTD